MHAKSGLRVVLKWKIYFAGCVDRQPSPTLIVHYHGGVYDFIGHKGQIAHTSTNIDEFRIAIKKPSIQKLIIGSRVVVRFAGVRDAGRLSMPEELVPAMAELAGAGVMRQDFDYTND